MNGLIAPSIASIQGAWAALRFDDDGYARIDGSAAGFRRSWSALLLALPFLALGAVAVSKATLAEPRLPDVPMLVAFFASVFQWFLGAGALTLIALAFGRRDRIRQLVATDNWISLWLLVLEAPFNLMGALGLLPGVAAVGNLLLSFFGLAVGARMLLVVLRLPLVAVMGIIIFLVLLQLSLLQVVQGLAG